MFINERNTNTESRKQSAWRKWFSFDATQIVYNEDLTCYLERHSPGNGCAGINGNNRVPNCRCLSSAILRPGDPDRHPVLVPPSEAVDGRSTGSGEILLRRAHPPFQLAATLLAPMHCGLGVDDLADEFAGRTLRSMPEPTKSTLKKHRRQTSKVDGE